MLTKIFQSGGSQAVRIPKDFRFNGDTVEIFRAENGDVAKQPAWRRTVCGAGAV